MAFFEVTARRARTGHDPNTAPGPATVKDRVMAGPGRPTAAATEPDGRFRAMRKVGARASHARGTMTGKAAAPRLGRSLGLTLLVAGVACAGIRPGEDRGPQAGQLITAQQIARSGARTAWEALQKNVTGVIFDAAGGIHRRGTSSVTKKEDMRVYVDNVMVNDVRTLHDMPAADIRSIRVLSGIDATTYFGTSSIDGAILIRTRP